MAGMGKRMRPHTLTIPKPLFPIAGKPIVQRLVEEIYRVCKEDIEEIAFIIGDFGKDIEGTINGELALGEGQFLSTIRGSEAEGIIIRYDN